MIPRGFLRTFKIYYHSFISLDCSILRLDHQKHSDISDFKREGLRFRMARLTSTVIFIFALILVVKFGRLSANGLILILLDFCFTWSLFSVKSFIDEIILSFQSKSPSKFQWKFFIHFCLIYIITIYSVKRIVLVKFKITRVSNFGIIIYCIKCCGLECIFLKWLCNKITWK